MGGLPRGRRARIEVGLDILCRADKGLSRLRRQHGAPQFGGERDPYTSIGRAIVFQQLAGSAARAIFGRFLDLHGGEFPSPEVLAKRTVEQLRPVGLSRPKASYLIDLATHVSSGSIDRRRMARMKDEDIIASLTQVKGVGPWTVDMYLLFGLSRLDTLPVGDYGVRVGFRKHFGLGELPKPALMRELAEPWRPYRGLGCWYMWRLAEE